MKELFGHSCLGYCYAYLAARTDDIRTLTKIFMNGWFDGYIMDDGYVKYPVDYLRNLGIPCRDILKVQISQLSELPKSGVYAVEYKNPHGGSHFVVADRSGVLFDPSYPSDSVKSGVILSYRKLV